MIDHPRCYERAEERLLFGLRSLVLSGRLPIGDRFRSTGEKRNEREARETGQPAHAADVAILLPQVAPKMVRDFLLRPSRARDDDRDSTQRKRLSTSCRSGRTASSPRADARLRATSRLSREAPTTSVHPLATGAAPSSPWDCPSPRRRSHAASTGPQSPCLTSYLRDTLTASTAGSSTPRPRTYRGPSCSHEPSKSTSSSASAAAEGSKSGPSSPTTTRPAGSSPPSRPRLGLRRSSTRPASTSLRSRDRSRAEDLVRPRPHPWSELHPLPASRTPRNRPPRRTALVLHAQAC